MPEATRPSSYGFYGEGPVDQEASGPIFLYCCPRIFRYTTLLESECWGKFIIL